MILTGAFGLGLCGLFALLPLGARSLEPREVVVIARQMSFYAGDGVTANPTIRMTPGETVRLTLIAEDPGFDHDFVVTAWDAKTPMLHGKGRTSIVLRAPENQGTASYVCSIHASMMKGVIEVVAPASTTTR
jgi:plastocyanin